MNCSECKRAVPRGAPYWQLVEGWEQKRAKGGTNALALRSKRPRFMCEPCMHLKREERNKGGQHPGQTSIDSFLMDGEKVRASDRGKAAIGIIAKGGRRASP